MAKTLILQLLIGASGVLISCAGFAQANPCPSTKAIECFISEVKFVRFKFNCDVEVISWQFAARRVRTRNAIEARINGPQAALPPSSDIHTCIRQQKNAVQPFYNFVAESLANNKEGLSLLKDAYAYWLTSVDMIAEGVAILPTDEDIERYKRRISEREKGVEDRLNRLMLEN